MTWLKTFCQNTRYEISAFLLLILSLYVYVWEPSYLWLMYPICSIVFLWLLHPAIKKVMEEVFLQIQAEIQSSVQRKINAEEFKVLPTDEEFQLKKASRTEEEWVTFLDSLKEQLALATDETQIDDFKGRITCVTFIIESETFSQYVEKWVRHIMEAPTSEG